MSSGQHAVGGQHTSNDVQALVSAPQNTETQMRKLKIFKHITLDGVIQHSTDGGDFPYCDWTVAYRSPAGPASSSTITRLPGL